VTRRAWPLFALMSVVWGVPYLFIKVAVEELDPVVIVFARTFLAALVLLPVALHTGALRGLRRRAGAVLLLSLCEMIGPFLLISFGEQRISSSLTGLLIAALPLLVALLAIRLDVTERVTGSRLIGLLVGIGGVATLLGLDVGGQPSQLLGAAMVLTATVLYAAGSLLIKRLSDLPPIGVITASLLVTSVALAPGAVATRPRTVPSARVLLALLALAVACTAIAFLAYFALIAIAGASRATVITYVNPSVAVTLGVLILGEPVTAATVAGFLLILAGSWLSTGGGLPPRLTALVAGVAGRRGRWAASRSRAGTTPAAARVPDATGLATRCGPVRG
jgi:drug/metabolite transporter (DMT)-like permease